MEQANVLLVEDDEASRYIYGTILTHRGYTVRYARNGPQGLRMLREDAPDAVVLDIGIPGMDGFEVLERIREDPEMCHLPVVVVTVHVFEADQRRAEQAGCDLFLKKPLEPSLLVNELERLLSRPSAPPFG